MPLWGLYIHVPFCRCKCDWCAFASEEGARRSEVWLERVLDQLAAPPDPEALWASVYIGGGTPSLLEPAQLQRLLATVRPRLVPGAETTLEANPESLTDDLLTVFGQGGGTRLSLGIQTFDETILARHGRPTRTKHLAAAHRLVGDWTGQLSLDLICGLEGQTASSQRRDLDEALDWNPGHLSWYSLTLEPGTPLALRVRVSSLPSEDEAALWWLEGRDQLERAGLAPYEVSNFARPGAESHHNGRYWALEPWWGVGPSAASFLPKPTGGFEYRTEPSLIDSWLAGQGPRVEIPTALELTKDRLLAGLRRTRGVDALPWMDLLPRTLEAWSGRWTTHEGRLFLTREAFPYLDTLLRDAFDELDRRPEFQ